MKLGKRALLVLLSLGLLLGLLPAGRAQAAEEGYEIYPKPHSAVYAGGEIPLSDEVNLVLESGLDEATRNKARGILAAHGKTASESEAVVEGKTNLLVGVRGSHGVADQYVSDHVSLSDADLFNKIDGHLLSIKDDRVIAVLGRDTDAAFYGLVSLQHIFNQLQDGQLKLLQIEDYADTQTRGFIEGYYGFPWSNENRESLMEFGGQFKMTTYVFAPKDDPYHRDKWEELYPADKLEEIRQLAEAGNNNKVRYCWTVSPFVHLGRTGSGDEALASNTQILLDKFEQLYQVGVRQFGILGDDIGRLPMSYVTRQIESVTNWIKGKGDVYPLVYCPASYNSSWAWNQGELDTINQNFDPSVQIFWTGNTTCSPVNTYTVDQFRTKGMSSGSRRDPPFLDELAG